MSEPASNALGGGATGSGAHTVRSATPEKSGANNGTAEKKGWLLKWTNYIKGYQRRWFVLSKGVLSYYRNQAEINHTCRGTISLHGALIHTVDSCTFVISNGGTQTFHIKTANEVERQSWVTALELAKAKAINAMENEEEEEKETAQVVPSEEINTVVRDLTDRLENLRTCYDLIIKHGVALQRALSDLESNEEESLMMRTKIVNERATLFRITSNAMINACNDYLRCAESQGHKWSKMLQHERDQRQHLEDMVEQLAKQHTRLEQAAHLVQHNKNAPVAVLLGAVASTASVISDDEIEFFDAEEHQVGGMFDHLPQERGMGGEDDEENEGAFVMKMSKLQKRRNSSQEQAHTSSSSGDEASGNKNNAHPPREEQQLGVIAPDPDTKNPLVASAHSGNPFPGNPGNSPQSVDEQSMEDCVCTSCGEEELDRAAVEDTVDEAPGQSHALVAAAAKSVTKRQRRTRVPEKPNYPLNLWSIMKNCIGKELSKIPMPVNFNEPLSMLQRLTEDYEYADLLDVAANCSDECEQLAYVAAFTISSYSTTAHRTGKPFNPLLGETYECDRTDDLGWRCISEQVSHHPPMAALHCEGKKWICWQEFTMTSKFRGKYLQVS